MTVYRVEGSPNSRLDSESYYAEYAGGRTDIWVSQVFVDDKFVANVFFEVGSRPPQVDLENKRTPAGCRDLYLKLAKADFKKNVSRGVINEHLAFFREMKRKYNIWWQE